MAKCQNRVVFLLGGSFQLWAILALVACPSPRHSWAVHQEGPASSAVAVPHQVPVYLLGMRRRTLISHSYTQGTPNSCL